MPGLVGCFSPRVNSDESSLFHEFQLMSSGLSNERTIEEKVQQGRLQAGLYLHKKTYSDSGVKLDKDNNILYMIYGEIYNCHISDIPDKFKKKGKTFARELNGIFLILIYDIESKTIYLISDKFNLFPLYIWMESGVIYFSSKIKSFLKLNRFKPEKDTESFSDFFRYGHILGNKTHLKSVSRIPPASVITFDKSGCKTERYWDFYTKDESQAISKNECLEEIISIWDRVVNRSIKGDMKPIIQLSGGLDSRAIIAPINTIKENVLTFTLGMKGSDDIKIAKIISSRLNLQHYVYEIDGDVTADYAEEFVEITEGFASILGSSFLKFLPEVSINGDVIYNGVTGGCIAGGRGLNKKLISETPENLQNFVYKNSVQFSEEVIRSVFLKEVAEDILKTAFDNFKEVSEQITEPHTHTDQYRIENYFRTKSTYGLSMIEEYLPWRVPFYDNDFMEFIYKKVPANYLLGEGLYKEMILKSAPNLADIPREGSLLPIDSSSKKVFMHYQLTRVKRKLSLILPSKKLKERYHRLGSALTRSDLELIHSLKFQKLVRILLDQTSKSRGIYQTSTIEIMIERHITGEKNYIEILSQLVTYELFCRNFLD
jgi:asparagine synthase (glutamine-hydrolysing)